MAQTQSERFVRFPTQLLETFMRTHFTGTQWCVVMWVVRSTYGWNRLFAPFTWYRIAEELKLDRAAVYRAGQSLLKAHILVAHEKKVAIERDQRLWALGRTARSKTGAQLQLWMPGFSDAAEQRLGLPVADGDDAGVQPRRCLEATLFRPSKESSKERLKKEKDSAQKRNELNSADEERRSLAGSAVPIPGKYDRLSQN